MEFTKHILSHHFAFMIQTPNDSDKLSGLKITFANMNRTKKTEVNLFSLKKKKYESLVSPFIR